MNTISYLKTTSTSSGIIEGYPVISEADPVDYLRRGLIPKSRPDFELVEYAKVLENIIALDYPELDFKELHEYLAPHWCDLLENE